MRTGDELGMCIEADMLTLVAINSSKSAYLKVDFLRSFFESYELLPHPADQNIMPGIIECSVSMRNMMNALKSTVMTNQLRICVDPQSSSLIVEHQCQEDIVKVFRVPLLNTSVLNATYNKSEYPLVLVADPHILHSLMGNFSSGSGSSGSSGLGSSSEIRLSIDHMTGQVSIQSHVDHEEEQSLNKMSTLVTSMNFDLHEMFGLDGQVVPGLEMTFSTRDFKQFVAMCCESFMEIRIFMHQEGRCVTCGDNHVRLQQSG